MNATNLVDTYVDALGESGENNVPMATTDVVDVVRSQLTENTGRHLLDSGSHYGRNWEENRENPPWEQPDYTVRDEWVTENVYHFMTHNYDRDETAVLLEIGLYAFGYHGPGEGDSWRACAEDFAGLLGRSHGVDVLVDSGLPESLARDIIWSIEAPDEPLFGGNTYNSEWGTLSQDLNLTAFGGPYAEYAAVRVHGGCDIRGGYTSPRIYRDEYGGWFPMEREYRCHGCDWFEAESVLGYPHPEIVWLPDAYPAELIEELDERGYDYHDAAVDEVIEEAEETEGVDGAVVHLCGDGELSLVAHY
jgi:hypothetical protein